MSEQASSESVPQRQFVVRAVLRSDVGLVRSENQDFGMYTTAEEEIESHPGGRLLIVADGMGGHRGGATASRLAAETVKAQFLGSETADIPTALRESLTRANARIYSEAQANPELRGMGTTTSVLAVNGDRGWLAHVGDSRIYRVRDNAIEQLTDDHSLVATMVREGLLTPAEAETHPRRNVLQRSMGVAEDVEVDVRGPFELRSGDTFILCSDGLHGLVKEPELREIARKPIDQAADEFLRKALERGAPDNVTVIVARVEASDGSDDEPTLVEALDETQPLDFLDETMKDTQKLPAVTASEAAAPPSPRVEQSQTPRAATTARPEVAKPRASVLKWTLLAALALGAAGAYFYWNQQQAIAKESGSTTQR
ncbi:MAG TPA: Stp1/IreP family PP2C-type Ser/Thr phosphatase [Thermoanaerobaculia bacterium]|jgi:protein phosphatase